MENDTIENFKTFSKKMKEVIAAEGMTNKEFAKHIGVTESTVYNANKNNKPSINLLDKFISKYPEIDLNWLLKDSNLNSFKVSSIAMEERGEYITFIQKNLDRLKGLIND